MQTPKYLENITEHKKKIDLMMYYSYIPHSLTLQYCNRK